MPLWLGLIFLGGAGYFAYEMLFAGPLYPEGIVSPASQAIFDAVKSAEIKYDAGELSAEEVDAHLNVIADNQRSLREAEQMSMAEYNILQDYKVALWGKVGML